jgi:hypothetical protein
MLASAGGKRSGATKGTEMISLVKRGGSAKVTMKM